MLDLPKFIVVIITLRWTH